MELTVRKRNTYLQKLFGLHWHIDKIPIYFTTRWGIHTFGMRSNILCLVLDDDHTVVNMKLIKPNRIYLWDPRYSIVVEIPEPNETHLKISKGKSLQLLFI